MCNHNPEFMCCSYQEHSKESEQENMLVRSGRRVTAEQGMLRCGCQLLSDRGRMGLWELQEEEALTAVSSEPLTS